MLVKHYDDSRHKRKRVLAWKANVIRDARGDG